jgi:large subunit ribosomal protein L35
LCIAAEKDHLITDVVGILTNAKGEKMSKMKTHKGAAKRFKKTAGGYKFRRSNRAHILTKKAQKRKRHLRANPLIHTSNQLAVARLLTDQ